MVAERRKERVQQITVGRMDFNQSGASGLRPARRRDKSSNNGNNLSSTQGMGYLVAVGKREWTGRHDWNPATFLRRNRSASFPRFAGARLSAGVGKLYAGDRALLFDERKDPAQRLHMRVTPYAKIHGADAAVSGNGGGFRPPGLCL